MPFYEVPCFCGIYYVPVIDISTPDCKWLPQVSLSTDCKLFDTSSRTVLTQTFVNPSTTDVIKKAKYNFPLYESCAVVAFRCFVEDRLIEGVAKGKEEAKEEYNKAVSQGETAALFEQFTPDVFRTSLGNIPAGATVKVEVEYIMELKHDAEVDGLRFTIPTSIAPRYGRAPSDLSTYSDGKPIAGAIEKGGMKISVQITMPSNVRSVQSPSHPITVHLGGHADDVADDAFNPKHAFATLGQTSTELGADFILLVKCTDLSSPRALLEEHSTKSDSKALMVTLVPKFVLPVGQKPEIVFIADRSGSMDGRMTPLKSALSVFLKSLPVGVKFNICSFGSSHSFLWSKSQAYSADTLEQAQRHIDSMDADMGGTEILPPIKATVSQRLKDLPLEIMVLTDGEVWDTEPLFEFIEKATASGDVRLFSLGIGRDVSHSLVEGMARVGRGFAQIVSDEQEGIEGKVVRMLRGGLSAHIKDYRLEWEGRPTEEQAKTGAAKRKQVSPLQRAVQGVKKISLFDKKANPDLPISSAKSRADRFADLPEFVVPTVLQAPYKLPPLFPFSRTTVYVILSGAVTPPSSVWLRGTTPSGDELELEIPVHVLSESGMTIHQLAARKMLQELEEGNGYLHSGKYGVDKEKSPGTFDSWVEREGIRLGVEYGLASKWTSFVAVQKRKKAKEVPESPEKQGEDDKKEIKDADDEWTEIESATEAGKDTASQEAFMVDQDSESSPDSNPRLFSPVLAASGLPGGPSPRTMARKVRLAAPKFFAASFARPSLSTAAPPPPAQALFMAPLSVPAPAPMADAQFSAPSFASAPAAGVAADHLSPDSEDDVELSEEADMSFGLMPTALVEEHAKEPAFSPSAPDAAEPAMTAREQTKALIALQSFEGSFSLTTTLASILRQSLADLESKLNEFTLAGSGKLGEDDKKKIWATLLAVSMFENKLTGEKDMWELVVEKARDWLSGLSLIDKGNVEKLDKMANDLLTA